MKRSWTSIVIVTGVLGVLTLFLGLQYRWLSQASEAERERMQKRAETDATRFAEDFNREMQAAYYNFQTDAVGWKAADWSEFNERYDYWKSRTAYPDLVREIYFVARVGDGKPLRYNKESRSFEIAEPDPELERVRTLARDDKNGTPVVDDASAMILPIYEHDERIDHIVLKRTAAPRQPPMVRLPEKYGWIVIMLDDAVVKGRLLADLSQKYFPEKDYAVAVSGKDGQLVFSTAGLSRTPDATGSLFDLSADKMLFFANRELVPKSGERHDLVINQRVESHTFTARSKTSDTKSGTLQVEMKSPSGTRQRTAMIADTGDGRGPWKLEVQHAAGSIDAFVSGERNKSFLIGLGVYLLLVGGIAAILFSALRSKRFAQRQIDFVSSVSHEFRTPLAVIYSAGENLADGVAKDDAQVSRYGELIKGEGKKLSGMVEQILEFAGANSGRQKFNFGPVEVSEIVNDAIGECSPLVESKGFAIETSVPNDLPLINADRSALSGALQNLIANSVKYSNGSKWIKISATNGRGTIKISVEDKGIGIESNDLRLIFEPFYRTKDVVDAQISGNGLGLNLVKKIVEAHGGKVSAMSKPGSGSTFTIELPQK